MKWCGMTQAVKHVYVSKAQSKLVLSSLAFSRCSFSKTERNGTRQDSSGGVEKRVGSGRVSSGRVGSGRVGSGRVGSGESRSLPVPTQASLFFRSAVTIALLTYFTLRFTSWTPRRGCDADKLSIKAVMQTSSDYNRWDKMNANPCRIYK